MCITHDTCARYTNAHMHAHTPRKHMDKTRQDRDRNVNIISQVVRKKGDKDK